NDHFFWVDDFACPASFPWHTAKNVTRDHAPVAADFNAQDYATLAAHPSSFWKFPEAFLCLVGLSRYYPLDEETYPWFLHKNREGGYLWLYMCHAFLETDITQKEEKQSQKRQSTGWKRQSQIEAKVSQIQKVNPDKVKSQPSEENTT
ncbi:hypothetical protein Tco_1411246, partial [Tanacetum coccineum]